MIRLLAASAGLVLFACAGAAMAQTYAPSWGQPIYLDGGGRPLGVTPLSEVETRSYAETGRWADGYSDRPQVHVPSRTLRYGYGYGPGRYRNHGYGRSGYDRRPYQGYRDAWGYNDDRARPGRQGYVNRHERSRDRGPDVYVYDR